MSIRANLYEGLIAFDREMHLVPALAVSWNSLDERTWLFELRKGLHFHDGRLLQASDVKAALESGRSDPASQIQGYLATIEDVEVLGEHALKLRTRRADPLLLNRLTYVDRHPSGP